MNIKDKRIVITGATSGIGLEVLKLLQCIEGSKIIAVGRKIENIPNYPNVFTYKCDVSIPEEMDKLFKFSLDKMGGIDIFLANAGFGYYEVMNKANWNHIENIYRTNVISPFYTYQKMIELNGENEFYFLITASAVSFFAMPYYTLYSSTKFALNGFLDGIRFEKPKNAHIALIYPVATKTKFFKSSSISTQGKEVWPTQTPNTVAKAIIIGIRKNKKRIIPSPIFKMGLFFGKFFPNMIGFTLKLQIKKPI